MNSSKKNKIDPFKVALTCIIKDEQYLEEFIIYHHLIGIQHFYIYDNESKIPIKTRLIHPFFLKHCTIINFPGKAQQVNAYNHCRNQVKNFVDWLIVIDGDEYIHLKKHKNIIDFVKDYKEFRAIGINWVFFGSNHHIEKPNGLVLDNYTKCEKIQNKHVKTMCRPRYVNKIYIHGVELNKTNLYIDSKKNIIEIPFNENHTIDIIQINHYWGKSEEDLKEKIERGRAPIDKKREMPKNYHQMFNSKVDESLKNKYSHLVKKKMIELNLMKINL